MGCNLGLIKSPKLFSRVRFSGTSLSIMKKYKYKEVKRYEEVTEDILCNRCGHSCGGPSNVHPRPYLGLIEVMVSVGYDSLALEDGIDYTFPLCEPCSINLFDKFKHQPEKDDYIKVYKEL